MAKQGSGNPPEQDKTFSTRQTEQYQENKKKLIVPFQGALVLLSIPRPNSEFDWSLQTETRIWLPASQGSSPHSSPGWNLSQLLLLLCRIPKKQGIMEDVQVSLLFWIFCLLRKRKAKTTPGLSKLKTAWFLKCKLFGGKARKTRYSLVSRFLHSCSWDGFLFLDYSGERDNLKRAK